MTCQHFQDPEILVSFHGTVFILEDLFMLNPNLPMKISKNEFLGNLDPLEDDGIIVMLILWAGP
jgi:hypothetical protein